MPHHDQFIEGQHALQQLKEGNLRYIKNLNDSSKLANNLRLVAEQNPFAIILGCSDARVPVEMIFDQGCGELFVIRVAGNVVAPSQIGSVEFAVEAFQTRLVVVLGHSRCGAVSACVNTIIDPDHNYSPNLQSIVDRIRPSVYNLHELATANNQNISADELIHRSIRANVSMSVSQLKHGSRILEDMVANGDLLIVGAEYNLQTGKVDFFDY